MLEGSHETAAALLPVGILHTGNLLDDFGEDALSQLHRREIQGKKVSSLPTVPPSSKVNIPLSTIPTTKHFHKKKTLPPSS